MIIIPKQLAATALANKIQHQHYGKSHLTNERVRTTQVIYLVLIHLNYLPAQSFETKEKEKGKNLTELNPQSDRSNYKLSPSTDATGLLLGDI